MLAQTIQIWEATPEPVQESLTETVTIEQWVIIVFVAILMYLLGSVTQYAIHAWKQSKRFNQLEKEQLKRKEERYGRNRQSDSGSDREAG